MPKELTQGLVERWVADCIDEKFYVRDLKQEMGIESEQGNTHLRQILKRLRESKVIFPDGMPGCYRIYREATILDWQNADVSHTVALRFPFEIEKYAKIYPKSIIIVAGGKNAGKTAFMYNFITMNMFNHQIDLYNSETGAEQMKERFSNLNVPVPAPFLVYERYDHFADILEPDHVSVIDYLDLDSEVYLVGGEINEIFKKINNVAVIGLQKPPPSVVFERGIKKYIERDLAYGGGFTAKRAVLYISMGSNKLKLVYVKTPMNPKLNPTNKTWTYRIGDDGVTFEDIQPYYGDTQQTSLPYKDEE